MKLRYTRTAAAVLCAIAANVGWAAPAEELSTIPVEATRLSDVSGEEVKSADLAEALVKKVPNISLVRRSGIANDIILRGQKKDNINVLIDSAKVYGACPNRMDPTTSHVLTNNIEGVEVIEGPYDVENFGTLSGSVDITTQKPKKGFNAELSLNAGSWGYRKGGLTLSGGNDRVRLLASASTETSEQYEDGDGRDFAEQIKHFTPMAGVHLKAKYDDMDAYEKKTFMGKIYLDVTDNQELAVSYTANRSDDVLYPSSKMDAIYDDSDILTLGYTIRNLSAYSKSLELDLYNSEVIHPMSTYYRNSSGPGSANEVISKLTTRMQGAKLTNTFDLDSSTEMKVGVDYSKRNWNGKYEGKGAKAGITGRVSINDVDTENKAIFAEIDRQYTDVNLRAGARYDSTSVDPTGKAVDPSNDYDALSGFVFATYQANATTKLFGGLGKSSRVPDGRELYFRNAMGRQLGTPDLDQTSNYEIDLGMENNFDNLMLKTRVFHSWLKDFIYYNSTMAAPATAFENVDATIYGIDVSGTWFLTDEFYLDFGLAYQRGRKDHALTGQTDRDMAEIPPLKGNLALNYDYGMDSNARVELVAADSWDDIDSENGEQKIDGYAVVNMKVQHKFNRNIEFTLGVDNVFDKTYSTSNTYKDLTLLLDGSDVMSMNEPGRYLYLNAVYRHH